jgi:hypothetical protein
MQHARKARAVGGMSYAGDKGVSNCWTNQHCNQFAHSASATIAAHSCGRLRRLLINQAANPATLLAE